MARKHAGLQGVLVLDKPAGPSSHDCVVAARRRSLGAKTGHAGTLDPFATGVLPLLLGPATRLSRFFTGARKEYAAVVRFGAATTSGDPHGDPCGEGPIPDEGRIVEALAQFTGPIEQVPPAFSAKSVDGERAYKRARRGDLTAPHPVRIEIHEATISAWNPPDATILVACSAGTYIRALARDLGEACGSAAHCAQLRRVRSGAFGLEHAVTLEELEGAELTTLRERLVPMRDLLQHLPAVSLTAAARTALRHGKLLLAAECRAAPDALQAEWVRMLAEDGELLALGGNAGRFNRPEDFHASIVLPAASSGDP